MKAKFRFLGLLLVIFLLLSAPVTWASDSTLGEVRSLLQNEYVDPVSQSVLDAGTIPDMLKSLGDPYTMYFSPEEYQSFLSSIEDVKFAGIGVNIDIVPEGVLVTNILSGSAAESVGLKQGDIIIRAGDENLAGLPSETAVSILRGPEGSQIQLQVKRQGIDLTFTVTRKLIEIPTVTGEVKDKHIGYIDINSFGSNTSSELGAEINNLRMQNVNSWIVDLRDNPGGYLSTVIDLASYFIGANDVVQIRDRAGKVTEYTSPDHGVTLKQPIIFLTNSYSASASEILSASVKDNKKATLLGTRTFGKGTVQSMYDLGDGSVLKMTIARFYSPLGNPINKVGVSPDVVIEKTDPEKTAELLLKSTNTGTDKSGLLEVSTPENDFPVSLAQARTPEFWTSFAEILSSLPAPSIHLGTSEGWKDVNTEDLSQRYPLIYPGYQGLGTMENVPLDKKFTVLFSGYPDWSTLNAQSAELINSITGERVKLEYSPLDSSRIQLTPSEKLQPGTVYWLVLHPLIKGTNGLTMKNGSIEIVKTVQ